MAATFNKFNQFVADLANKVHNLGADTLKVMLSNVAPTAAGVTTANITEIAAGNGYTAGGSIASLISSVQVAGLYILKLNNVTFTAALANIATFRYIVLYNSVNSRLIGWYDFGSGVVIAADNSFQVQFDAVNGALELQ